MLLLRSLGFALLLATSLSAADLNPLLETILTVDQQGKGHKAAVAALKELEQQPAAALPTILAAFDKSNPVSENWLRGAVETIFDRALKTKQEIPRDQLEAFVLDSTHSAHARRLAYEWLLKSDPGLADRLIPKMLNDPSVEFRRDAVQRLIDQGKKEQTAMKKEEAIRLYEQAFAAARDPDQMDALFDTLKELGKPVNLQRQLGLITKWHIIGPFDHRKGIGFDKVYPPETEIDLKKTYPGLMGDVAWVQKESTDKHGVLNIATLFAPHKGAVMYATQTFNADKDRDVEIRLGTPNGWKLWVNGKLVFAHEEYHRSMRLDQFQVRTHLHAGPNQILLKVCQNEQTEDWAQRYQFQLRVCDLTGGAILPTTAVSFLAQERN
ncbi:MAG: hypothetical protein U0903_05440 [Planctomycetales bacterium]